MPKIQDLKLLPQGGHGFLPVVSAAIAKTQPVLASMDTLGNLVIWDIPSGKQLAGLPLVAWDTFARPSAEQEAFTFSSSQLYEEQIRPSRLLIREDKLYAYGRNAVFQFGLSNVYEQPIFPSRISFYGRPGEDQITFDPPGSETSGGHSLQTGKFTFAYNCHRGILSAQQQYYLCVDPAQSVLFLFPIGHNSTEPETALSWQALGAEIAAIEALSYREKDKELAVVYADEQKKLHLGFFTVDNGALQKQESHPIAAPFWLSPEADYALWVNRESPEEDYRLYRTDRSNSKHEIAAIPPIGDILQLDYDPGLDYCTISGFTRLLVYHLAPFEEKFRLAQPGFSRGGKPPKGAILKNKYKPLALSPDGQLLASVPSWIKGETGNPFLAPSNGHIYLGNIEKRGLERKLNEPRAKIHKLAVFTPPVEQHPESEAAEDAAPACPPTEFLNIFLDNGAICSMQLGGAFQMRARRSAKGFRMGYYDAASNPADDVVVLLEYETPNKKAGSLAIIHGVRQSSHRPGEGLSLEKTAFSPDGRFLAVADGSQHLAMILQAESLEVEKKWAFPLMQGCENQPAAIRAMAFHPQRPWLAIARAYTSFLVEIAIYDWSAIHPKRVFHHILALRQSEAFEIDFGATGRYFIFRASKAANIWRLSDSGLKELFVEKEASPLDEAKIHELSLDQLSPSNLITQQYATSFNSPVLLNNDSLLLIESIEERTIEIWPLEEFGSFLKKEITKAESQAKIISTGDIPYSSFVVMKHHPVIIFYRELDGWIRLVNWETQQTLGNIFSFDVDKFLIANADNYYFTNPDGYGLASFKFGRQIFPMEQFDLMANRPDKVLRSLGLSTTEEVAAFTEAYEKRMLKVLEQRMKESYDLVPESIFSDFLLKMLEVFKEKGGDDTFQLSNVEITNLESLGNISKKKTIQVKARIATSSPAEKPLGLNVYVNDVPLYGKGGIPLQWGKMASYMDKTNLVLSKCQNELAIVVEEKDGQLIYHFTIDCVLSKGENKVQVSVLNMDGVESFQTFHITYNTTYQPKLYFIGIAVGEHEEKSLKLEFPEKDLAQLTKILEGKIQAKPSNLKDRPFIPRHGEDTKPTLEQIRKLLREQREILRKANVDDQVILFYSGHGKRNLKLDLVLSTYDMKLEDFSNVLPYSELEDFMDGIMPRNKLIIVDACESGELNVFDLKRKPILDFSGKEKETAIFNLLKDTFIDLRRGSGTTILAASQGDQNAKDSILVQNIENFADGRKTCKASELAHYLIHEVPAVMVQKILKDADNGLEPDLQVELKEEILNLLALKLPGRQFEEALRDRLEEKFENRIPFGLDITEQIMKNVQQPTLRAENISNDWRIW